MKIQKKPAEPIESPDSRSSDSSNESSDENDEPQYYFRSTKLNPEAPPFISHNEIQERNETSSKLRGCCYRNLVARKKKLSKFRIMMKTKKVHLKKKKKIMKMQIIKNPRSMTITMNYHKMKTFHHKCQEDLVVTVGHQSGSGQGTI